MNYDEWILFGIMQGYCTKAACLVHDFIDLIEQSGAYDTDPFDNDEPECVPGVALTPPEAES